MLMGRFRDHSPKAAHQHIHDRDSDRMPEDRTSGQACMALAASPMQRIALSVRG
ncbi:hypothetical protein D2E24_1247 [Bifidobacterium samirii]|uniref:Uncharacterized protein n=1 Tax=Bifidobacterium samirii TaxID=2306974 RepID=A0A430FTV0_9BIFI|nr:hypothetical protein D2E24_1247 [Bifidobacterium samirii]